MDHALGRKDRTLDRGRRVDLRSLNYSVLPLGTVDSTLIPLLRSANLRFDDTVLDQGSEGSCVGHGSAHALMSDPIAHSWLDHPLAYRIYEGARRRDEWAGEDYEGTSVLGGCQYLKDARMIEKYLWCLSAVQVAFMIGVKRRAVIMGCDWYNGMWDTDANGFIHPTGGIVGGHCVDVDECRVAWLDRSQPHDNANFDWLNTYVGGPNSWGPDWGVGGRWKMSLIDFAKLVPGGDFAVLYGEKRASTPDNIIATR